VCLHTLDEVDNFQTAILSMNRCQFYGNFLNNFWS